MSRNSKILVGILSFLPIILLFVMIPTLLNLIPQFIEWDKHEPAIEEVLNTIGPFFFLIIFMGLLSLGLLVFFIIHLVNNKSIESGEKIVWIIVFLFVSMVGYPVYWFVRIWNEKPVTNG